MARKKSLKIWVDALAAARLSVRAEEVGTTVSEYVADLVSRDLGERGRADALAGDGLEMHFLTAILLRSLLGKAVGETEADKLVERARKKAHEQARAVLADTQATPKASA